jgi:hypothetical protein
MSSYTDGRLHSQITTMQNAGCWFYGLMLIGDPTSQDGGFTVGDGTHSWSWTGFDDAVLDVQVMGGVKIIRAPSKDLLAKRIAGLWAWSGKDEFACWEVASMALRPSYDKPNDPVTLSSVALVAGVQFGMARKRRNYAGARRRS